MNKRLIKKWIGLLGASAMTVSTVTFSPVFAAEAGGNENTVTEETGDDTPSEGTGVQGQETDPPEENTEGQSQETTDPAQENTDEDTDGSQSTDETAESDVTEDSTAGSEDQTGTEQEPEDAELDALDAVPPTGAFHIGDQSYTTLTEAVSASVSGNTITFGGSDITAEMVDGACIPYGVTLEVTENTSIAGSGNNKGITLASGAVMKTDSNAALTMSGYATSLTVSSGAVLSEGTYVFDDVRTGINLLGEINGANVTVNARKNSVGIDTGADAEFNNATVIWNGGGQDGWTYRNITAADSHIEISDVWLYGYPIELNDCYFRISGRFNEGSWTGGHVLAVYEKPAVFNDSEVVVEGSRINVIHEDGLTINNSTVTVQNSPDGGFNVNYGSTLNINNSKLISQNVKGAFIAAGYNDASNLNITGSSVIQTAAASDADSIGANGSFTVTGGSYQVYEPALSNSQAVPTNGEENGNEKLTLFTLADSSVTQLNPINKLGSTYTYDVASANDDGVKRVWVPAAAVTYKLNNNKAVFADGSSEDKQFRTIRGYQLTDVQQTSADPGTPSASDGTAFLGWYYKDASGTEYPFDYGTAAVKSDLEVYAKWDTNAVIYHNGSGVTYVESAENGAETAVTADYNDVVSQNSSFRAAGKKFQYWTAAEDGSGEKYNPGDTLTFSNGSRQIDLYAQYKDDAYSISFSANGGTFSQDSIFRNEKYFTIEKDLNGGDVAVLNAAASYKQTLHDATDSIGLDYNLLKPDADAVMPGYAVADATYWYQNENAENSIRFDDYKFWGFTIHGRNPVITGNVTYYLKWNSTADENNTVSDDWELSADMWSDPDDSTAVLTAENGSDVTLTGAVDAGSIKNKMDAIAEQFGVSEENYSAISLFRPESGFTAELTLPEGIEIPDEKNLTVEAQGLGDCFTLSGYEYVPAKRMLRVKFELVKGITDFRQLYDAVHSTGIESGLTDGRSDTIVINVSGLRVNSTETYEILTATGSLKGSFEAYAVMNSSAFESSESAEISLMSSDQEEQNQNGLLFRFTWTGRQNENGKDSSGAEGLAASYGVYNPTVLNLPGDITTAVSDGEADSTQIRPVSAGEYLDYIGKLDVTSIQERISDLADEQRDENGSLADIAVKNVASTFTAEISLPEGLRADPDSAAVLSDTDLFHVESTDVSDDGSTVAVTMKLNKTYESFQDLLDDVTVNTDPELKVTVSGIHVLSDVRGNEKLTAVGTLKGSFYGEAYKNGKMQIFAFEWNAVQDEKGKDAAFGPEDSRITYTVQTGLASELPSDILVGTDTEHDAVYETETGSTLAFTGALDVSSIQEKMHYIEGNYPDTNAESITLKDSEGKDGVTFGFTMQAVFPEGIAIPEDLEAEVQDNTFSDGAFVIHSTKVDGQTVTVEFGLKDPETITTFAQLKEIVDKAGGENSVMKILLPGLQVNGSGQMTVKAELNGYFAAYAAGTSRTMLFNFSWNAVQATKANSEALGEGRDFIQSADDPSIGFTLNASSSVPTPDTPAADVTVNDPPVRKTVEGSPSVPSVFTFELAPASNTAGYSVSDMPMPEGSENGIRRVSVTGEGEAEFGQMTFTKAGTYVYRVREIDDGIEGYAYDGSVYLMTYTVSEENGALKAERVIARNGAEYSDEALVFTNIYSAEEKEQPGSTENNPSDPDLPSSEEQESVPSTENSTVKKTLPVTSGSTSASVKTGVNNNLAAEIGIMLAAIAAAAAVFFLRKKRED